MANTRMPLSRSRHLQCYLKIRYIHGALRRVCNNAQCTMQQFRRQPFFNFMWYTVMKSWNLKMHFPGQEKSWIQFRKNDRGHGKVIEFRFLVQIFHAVWKLETFSLLFSKNMLHLLVLENLNWSWTSHWILLLSFCVNPAVVNYQLWCSLAVLWKWRKEEKEEEEEEKDGGRSRLEMYKQYSL